MATATIPAMQDFADLRTVINAAASAIGDPNNSNRGFGFNWPGSSNQMGTADLVNNITSTILRGKFQLDTNKAAWLTPATSVNVPPAINSTAPPTQATPTLPLTASLVAPTVIPTATLKPENLTVDLTTPYIDYVQAIPNLSSSLTALGREFHREMNAPVNEAIAGLQESLTTLQTAMLDANLINAQAVIRTIRASSSLESSQTAWGRSLNLPGGGSDDASAERRETWPRPMTRRAEAKRPPPKDGKFYTHQELWDWVMSRRWASTESKTALHAGASVQLKGHQAPVAVARVARRFVV
ncbi:uncharacterized protein SETTUDRAFT_20369 [Exserohilum turcica Et28A]|uniref:Uncharacterized protein n=1 Tax=Exserohilum turcicum (strain 28A) TaxID=671987 RepID=R0JV00_EXST2|nr:uncharacterized protein SETTUDRAFT_20369 [Exserohilum turcica Et28A]EOA84853.1 hypothetical protein SETTUDRAFT_20369 [Exserohilum turcica Et28A]